MKWIIVAAVLTVMAIGTSLIMISAQSTTCEVSGELSFICGVQAPEDLVLVPGTRSLIASGMTTGSGLHLIDTQAKPARGLFNSGVSTVPAEQTRVAVGPGAPA